MLPAAQTPAAPAPEASQESAHWNSQPRLPHQPCWLSLQNPNWEGKTRTESTNCAGNLEAEASSREEKTFSGLSGDRLQISLCCLSSVSDRGRGSWVASALPGILQPLCEACPASGGHPNPGQGWLFEDSCLGNYNSKGNYSRAKKKKKSNPNKQKKVIFEQGIVTCKTQMSPSLPHPPPSAVCTLLLQQ